MYKSQDIAKQRTTQNYKSTVCFFIIESCHNTNQWYKNSLLIINNIGTHLKATTIKPMEATLTALKNIENGCEFFIFFYQWIKQVHE